MGRAGLLQGTGLPVPALTPPHLRRCRQMTYSDDLPQISVVFIFVNEALSVILRSVHSVVNHTPSQLLKEVILVDDNSDNGERPARGGACQHVSVPGQSRKAAIRHPELSIFPKCGSVPLRP